MWKAIKRMWFDLLVTVLGWLGFVMAWYDCIWDFHKGEHPVQDVLGMLLACVLGILMGFYTHEDMVKFRKYMKEDKHDP